MTSMDLVALSSLDIRDLFTLSGKLAILRPNHLLNPLTFDSSRSRALKWQRNQRILTILELIYKFTKTTNRRIGPTLPKTVPASRTDRQTFPNTRMILSPSQISVLTECSTRSAMSIKSKLPIYRQAGPWMGEWGTMRFVRRRKR